MRDALNNYNPHMNAIGILQEYFQKRDEPLPLYEETSRKGPDHKPVFSVRVILADESSCEGEGPTLADARKNAAQKALEEIGRERQPYPR